MKEPINDILFWLDLTKSDRYALREKPESATKMNFLLIFGACGE